MSLMKIICLNIERKYTYDTSTYDILSKTCMSLKMTLMKMLSWYIYLRLLFEKDVKKKKVWVAWWKAWLICMWWRKECLYKMIHDKCMWLRIMISTFLVKGVHKHDRCMLREIHVHACITKARCLSDESLNIIIW